MSITTVLITKNEESNIKRCLDSVLEFSQEVILVDDNSTDQTVAIASQYPQVKVFTREFDNYILQKNYGNSLASSEYIFSIDADEWCDRSLIDYLVGNQNSLPDFFEIKRINYIKDKPIRYGLWRRDLKIRLWRKSIANWGGNTPHEYLISEGAKEVFHSKLIIHHDAYSSYIELYQKSMKYAELASKELSQKSLLILILSTIINPIFKFFKGFVLKYGFLDGVNGWMIAVISMAETFYKYSLAIQQKWK